MAKRGTARLLIDIGSIVLPTAVTVLGYLWTREWAWSVAAGIVVLVILGVTLEVTIRRPVTTVALPVDVQMSALRADLAYRTGKGEGVDYVAASQGAQVAQRLEAEPASRTALYEWASQPEDPQRTAAIESALHALAPTGPRLGNRGLALVAVVALGLGIGVLAIGKQQNEPRVVLPNAAPRGADGASTPAAPSCTYTQAARASADTKDVGQPSTKNVPHTGTRTATLATNFGDIKIKLAQAVAPCTVHSFTYLADKKFYDGSKCHRMTAKDIYVLQCGDPSGTGRGGPSYQYGLENAPSGKPAFKPGDVAMARTQDPNSNGSQFFIVYDDSPDLPGAYSLFGHITEGLDVITEKIVPNGLKDEMDLRSGQPMRGSGDGAPAKDVVLESVKVAK